MTPQANTFVEPEHDSRKYGVGQRLKFLGHSYDECFVPSRFFPGDRVVVKPRNGGGMGIDVTREDDGVEDMIWPEEVELIGGET